ncbi:hypothetical protein [Aquimarina aggregata]|uniref:hypothetical protein n=1 Tax=Aquimarina aggregata TaxID=1642818 RepID=UPI002490FCF1|nr:hypothetical protein [Aquimarina aggregata]
MTHTNYMRLLILIFGLLFCSYHITGQTDSSEISQKAIDEYFKSPRETLYTHVNKSTFLTGEEIWFKMYAYDRKNNLPSRFTTNFNVELFDTKGNQVFGGLFLGYRGSASGAIKIKKTWPSGSYYLRVSTNWMNNFLEEDYYKKEIKIVNQSLDNQVIEKSILYDFQLLPEGGHLIADAENTIGFKLTNNSGLGVSFDNGFVLDDKENKVASFTSNRFGIGKFSFNPQSNQGYTAVVVLDDKKEIKIPFPEIKKKGISITVNNLYKDNVIIVFNTNKTTLKEIKNKKHYLLIHQNGKSKKIAIDFSAKKTEKAIYIKRDQFYDGVNTITLFKNKTPILERLLFNTAVKKESEIELTYQNARNDSLLFNIKMPYTNGVNYDLSVSVLPEETKSYNHKDNIRSAILLKPYVKGFIQNPKYYFTNLNRRKVYNLDLLLLTQGWSKYNWDTVFNKPPSIVHNFNNGLTLKGKLQNIKNKEIKQVYLYPTKNNTSRLIDLDSTNAFKVQNYYPNQGELINVSAVNAKGKFIKTGIYVEAFQKRFQKPFSPPAFSTTIKKTDDVSIPSYFFGDTELLDEVLIKGKKKQKEEESEFLIGKSREISETDANAYTTIADYLIRSLGIRLNINPAGATENPNADNVQTPNILTNRNIPEIYLDDVQLIDFSILLSTLTQDVEDVYYDKFGFGGSSGEIRIYSKKSFFDGTASAGIDYKISEHTFKNGFTPAKEFYNPIYASFQDPLFRDYGTVHWQPRVIFDDKGIGTLKIPDTFLKSIKFYIEGIGSDGTLVSKIQTIKNINSN